MRINTNIASMTAQESAANVNKNLSNSLEKLSSGLRINKAADDASGMAIADKLRTQASSIGQSIENANSANALVQIADKAMAEQSNILDIIKTKLIQASTATTSNEGREAIRKDILKLQDQLNNIADQTNYNGTKLLQKDLVAGTDNQTATLANTTANAGEYQVHTTAAYTAASGTQSHNLVVDSNTITVTVGTSTIDGSTTLTAGDSPENVALAIAYAASQDSNVNSDYTFTTDGSGKVIITANNMAADVTITATSDVGGGDTNVSGNTTTNGAVAVAKVDTVTIGDNVDVGDVFTLTSGSSTVSFTATTTDKADIATGLAAALNASTDAAFTGVTADASAADGTFTLTADAAGTAFTITSSATNAQAGSTTTDALNFQIGELSTNDIKTSGGVQSNTSGLSLTDFASLTNNLLTVDIAESEMTKVDAALNTLNGWRSDFGSTQNQLDSSIRNMMTTQTNIKAAESVIRDVDYAAESANFNKQNIIAQAGTYAMSQANAVQQNVMRLLQ